MKQLKLGVSLLVASSCSITVMMFYWNRSFVTELKMPAAFNFKAPTIYDLTERPDIPMEHVNLNEIYKEKSKSLDNSSFETFDFPQAYKLIKTPGCQIPLALIDYRKMKKTRKRASTCGKRAVFIKKIDQDQVRATIKPKIIKTYLRKSVIFDCCYRFLIRPTTDIKNNEIRFTQCTKFADSAVITLESDFINIKCFDYDKRNSSHLIYDDVYAFAKRSTDSKLNGTILNKPKHKNAKEKYNVLMIGMDSMSLIRFSMLLPRMTSYFMNNYWLTFRGYHKVGDNTLPNLMAVLTGKNISAIAKACSGKMDECQKFIIWDKFKKLGYVTAYGEDYLRLPDTFTNKYAFKQSPTDHYMRPFFLKGETELNNVSLVCAGKVSSGQQILSYALDFVNTYRSEAFFGLFWINSFSHNINSRPQDADGILENFFNQLSYTGVLTNTFIIVLSDHGVRFGEPRLKAQSYYDERLPFLFMWTPRKFNARHPHALKPIVINQMRLVTPYDIYNTLASISDISQYGNSTSVAYSEACPNCHSLFQVVSENRTCQDVGIHDKWCSCHELYALSLQDEEGMRSISFVVSYIQRMIKLVRTNRCWGCMSLSLKNVLRTHYYFKRDEVQIKMYYVVAFTMTPGNVSYEATVLFKNGERELVGPVSIITPYRGFGKCTFKPRDRLFCFCQRKNNC